MEAQAVDSDEPTQTSDRAVTVLAEAFDRLRGMLAREDRGWVRLFGQDNDLRFGLRLEDLKQWGHKIEEAIPGAPWVGSGFRRRADFVWKDDIHYGNLPHGTQGIRNLLDVTRQPRNRENFYSPGARRQRERKLFTQGIAIYKGNDTTLAIEPIPLHQITDEFLDPEGLGFVWAYLREWSSRDPRTGATRQYARWYFTDLFKAERDRILNIQSPNGVKIPVDREHTFLVQHANRAANMVYGSPDGLAGFIWSGIARDAVMDGISMTEALARFALKAVANSKQGAKNAALQYAQGATAGSMAVVGGPNALQEMNNAGKAYDFAALRPLIAIAATSFDIPVGALTADSSGDGSYASAVTLDLPTRLAMSTRREEHVEFESRVLKWMGMRDEPDVYFHPYDSDDEVYRAAQGFMLGYANNLYTEQEARDFLDTLFGLKQGRPPRGAARPFGDLAAGNNAAGKSAALPQTASPTQGRSNGTGGQKGGSASKDIRTDKVAK